MIRCLSLLAHGGIILSLLFFVFEILDWYNPYMNFLGLKVSAGLMIAFCLLTLVQSAWVLHTLWQKSQGPFHQTPACSSQGAGQTAGTVTRTVGQVCYTGKS